MLEGASILDLNAAKHWIVRYRRGHSIFAEGDPAVGIYRVDKGCVRMQVSNADGDRQIIAFHFPGDIFGIGAEKRTSSAEAVSDVELTRYSLASLLELAARSTDVLLQIMRTADTVFGDLAHHVGQITHRPAAERVLWFLGQLSRREGVAPGEPVRLPMSRGDLSDHLGLSPETLSRIMRQLQNDGRISATGRNSFALGPRTHRSEWRSTRGSDRQIGA